LALLAPDRRELTVFSTIPTYSPYRALRLLTPNMQGEDVFALQTALNPLLVDPIVADGWFGGRTKTALQLVQRKVGATDDGVCGPQTWRAVAVAHANRFSVAYRLPADLLYGQLAHESSFLGGNYSAARPDGSYDAGVAQRNTAHTPAKDGFNHPGSIGKLADQVRDFYDLFAGVADTRRRWVLAQGSWNAPAFACWYAKREGATKVTTGQTAKPSVRSAELFAAYMVDVSAYLKVP